MLSVNRLIIAAIFVSISLWGQTTLPRTGMVQPAIGQPNWGPVINGDLGIMDALSGITSVLSTTYTLQFADQAHIIVVNTNSSTSISVPQPGPVSNPPFNKGWWAVIKQLGTGTVSLNPSASTIDGKSSINILPGRSTTIMTDGLNWFAGSGNYPAQTLSIAIENPQLTDSGVAQHEFTGSGALFARVECNTDQGEVDINFDIRTSSTSNTLGTQILPANLACLATGSSTIIFSTSSITAQTPLALDLNVISGVPGKVRVFLQYIPLS